MEGKGVVGETRKERREKWRLCSIFSKSFLDDFSPSLLLQSKFSRLLVSHVQDLPSLLRWESGRELLSPHPGPSYSWFSWCREF